MKRYRWNLKVFFTNLFILIGIIGVVWFGISYIEILVKNLTPNAHYCVINMFKVLGF